jgi:predicted house-cleaning NTP pyrophosphatase (Maf/HAM1 superfamily)
MRTYSDEEMCAYIATGDPLDKAGAYAIQHPGFSPVANLEGCYANVMGLPLCHLKRTLMRLGIQADRNIPQACQADLQYSCAFFPQVMAG